MGAQCSQLHEALNRWIAQPKCAEKTKPVDSAARPGRRLRLSGSWRPPRLLEELASAPVWTVVAIFGFEPSP